MKKIYPYIIIILLIVIAVIVFPRNHAVAPSQPVSTVSPAVPISPTVPTTPTQPATGVAVAGMKQYTDSSFGFSFWYPITWTVTTPVNPPFGVQTQGGTIVAKLGLQPAGQTYPSIMLEEFHSNTTSITDTGGAGPIGPITFFFDTSTHLWMTTSAIADGTTNVTKAANISNNSMGGLHLFGGTSRFDTNIIPLSAQNFVVMSDGGASNATAMAKTVVATDPSVATPVSDAEQVQTIQAEQSALSTE